MLQELSVTYFKETYNLPELKQAILDRFVDMGGIEELGLDQLIVQVKREEFGGLMFETHLSMIRL